VGKLTLCGESDSLSGQLTLGGKTDSLGRKSDSLGDKTDSLGGEN
jgi:hypothetical protein